MSRGDDPDITKYWKSTSALRKPYSPYKHPLVKFVRKEQGVVYILSEGHFCYPGPAYNNELGLVFFDLCSPQKWLTFITVTWCFFTKIITNNSCIFTVAAVVSSNILFDTVSQGPLISCALHIIHMDGSFSFPKISHGSCSGRTPANNAFLRMWWISQSYILINHNITLFQLYFLTFIY